MTEQSFCPAELAKVVLPLARLTPTLNNEYLNMSQEKVLIVEDEENERTGLAGLISSWGYVAETARDGQDGYEKVSSWAPHIVITDLKMPRLGGLELLEKISSDSQSMAVI